MSIRRFLEGVSATTILLLAFVAPSALGAPADAHPVQTGEAPAKAGAPSPLMKDFMGLCGHYFFDGPTYAPAAGLVRNYHSLNWDLDVTKPYSDPPYPFALNRVNWEDLYGGWRKAGFEIDACLMSEGIRPTAWVTPEETAYGYGKAFARFFGPSGRGLVGTVELGNEPGDYPDDRYVVIARAMARGLKEGDPRIRIATANLALGESTRYAKSVKCYEGWLDQIDILNVHSYALVGDWLKQRRTYPEDPASTYLSKVRDVLTWRDAHAPGKEVWVTEFGWDAHRAEGAPLEAGVPIDQRPSTLTRVQQAQFLARSYLIFARMGVERACMFWYRDEGAEKGLFNACGLISKGVRQPAFYALASLRKNLGDYAFGQALSEQAEGIYAYRFEDGGDRACVAVWSPTLNGEERAAEIELANAGLADFAFARAVELTTSESGDTNVDVELEGGRAKLRATGMPRLLFFVRKVAG
jgi:hypothetical protein